jgi:hypothetical protein
VLAYVFWHRPRPHVAPAHYEASLTAFHTALRAHAPEGLRGSLAFGLDAAPWLDGPDPAYEDWYLVDDWAAVGRLNEAAVHGPRRTPHHTVAAEAGAGIAGLYRRMVGAPDPGGAHATWFAKPDGMTYDELGTELDARLAGRDASLWQRQMTLGPTPELCLLSDAPVDLGAWRATAIARRPVVS